MALIDDIKLSLRIATNDLDAEVRMLIESAIYDMGRVGINPDILPVDADDEAENAFVKTAIAAYCKAQFGYDVMEANRFDDSYRRIVCDLLNSSENTAAGKEPVDDGGEEGGE